MDCQVSYNGPLSCSPLPCTFPVSRSLIPMNYPLPPKPPISTYFHVYTPARKLATIPRDMAAQHIDHGKPFPMNNDQERRSAHHHTIASSAGLLSGPHIDSVVCPSSEDTITGLENNYDKASNSDDSDDNNDNNDFKPPHPDKLFSWIRNNSEGGSCEALAALQSVDNRSGLNRTISSTSQLPGIGLSCGVLIASRRLVEGSQIPFSGPQGPQPVTETTLCSPSVSRSKRRSRKRPTRALLGHAELAADRGPRTRAMTRAEASHSKDKLLRELMHRKLSWEEIKVEFSQMFAGRDRKLLQGRWLRYLKFVTPLAKCLRTRGARNGAA
ncbi:hypothetical protein BJX62DRAFT_227461 [Aspergillus germanicus]